MTTIFALSSGRGRAGVAVIRISGANAALAVTAMAGKTQFPRQAALRILRHPGTGEMLDRALVLWFPAPASFTGEDVAEFHVHGGRAVIEAVIGALAEMDGLRPAEPGEFTRRAFENGKLDLTAVEGLADLIDAETEGQRRQALSQAAGGLAALYEGWRQRLIGAMASVEAALDFADEGDVPMEIAAMAHPAVARLHDEITAHLNDGNRGEIMREGFRVVLAGAPNVGKSSLLNRLARREAAIVSDEPGTTRDAIEVHLDLNGVPVIVTDTAGLRAGASGVEEEGIRRSLARAREANLIVWLHDGSRSLTDADRAHPPSERREEGVGADRQLIHIINKTDLMSDQEIAAAQAAHPGAIALSAQTGQGVDTLIARLTEAADLDAGGDSRPLITRTRHRLQLQAAQAALERFLTEPEAAAELRAEDLRQAATALGRLTGRVDVEDVLDAIFAGFCIGK